MAPASRLAPVARLATAVLRQIRRLLYVDGTVIAVEPLLTRNDVPVSEFSGAALGRRGEARVAPGAGPLDRVGRPWKCVSL